MKARIDGELFTDRLHLLSYATDASDYKEVPKAVVYPKHEADIRELVRYASENCIPLIPRTAGTSLAGQVVGKGIVVDMSRHMTGILEINEQERWVRVEPGVILDELNILLRSTGLFFSPETSTSNRSMIGGMIGNNSCGLHSLVHGTMRDHTLSIRAVLSDATVCEFGPLNEEEYSKKIDAEGIEGQIYTEINAMLSDPENQKEIVSGFPDPKVVRRNTGYALDELLETPPFRGKNARHSSFNLCKLLAGSEGTLLFITEAKLNLVPLPPPFKALVPIHFDSVMDAIRGNLFALKHGPTAVELMDKTILDCTRGNLTQRKNRFFLSGDPGAVLMVELVDSDEDLLEQRIVTMEKEMRAAGMGTHFPVVKGKDIDKVWALRKAGLGVLSNIPGQGRPVSVIEDTSVHVEVLEDYISEFNQLLDKYGLSCVYHAHISVGELHLRPILNLRNPKHIQLFHDLAMDSALLVKKYRGSLSGEHGDGRLRGEFIPLMVGERNFALIKQVKSLFDPEGIFNTEKITDTPPMNSFLRFEAGHQSPEFDTIFEYSNEGGLMGLIEKCNGSGDCRKTEITGGSMCPSYMATRDEMATTRARANVLRELLSRNDLKNPFDQPDIYKVLDLCLSCKACKSECPSSVDMAKIKAEFMQHWYEHHRIPVRTLLIANISQINRLGMLFPAIFNWFSGSKLTSVPLKRMLGFATDRSIPTLGKTTLQRWAGKHLENLNAELTPDAPEVVLYVDEFTNYNDTSLGITSIRLLNQLGIRVIIVNNPLSGRTYISKGLLKKARKIAMENVELFSPMVTSERPLVGIEPSAILGFRDEFPELVGKGMSDRAKALSEHCMTMEEYLESAFEKKIFDNSLFTSRKERVRFHGHCQQKAIASTEPTRRILSIPENYRVLEIPSGCCGMAGSFGYEKEHYELSQKVGELVLFPAVREADKDEIIVASGTSCRHQIGDGTGRQALHPVEVLYNALK